MVGAQSPLRGGRAGAGRRQSGGATPAGPGNLDWHTTKPCGTCTAPTSTQGVCAETGELRIEPRDRSQSRTFDRCDSQSVCAVMTRGPHHDVCVGGRDRGFDGIAGHRAATVCVGKGLAASSPTPSTPPPKKKNQSVRTQSTPAQPLCSGSVSPQFRSHTQAHVHVRGHKCPTA